MLESNQTIPETSKKMSLTSLAGPRHLPATTRLGGVKRA